VLALIFICIAVCYEMKAKDTKPRSRDKNFAFKFKLLYWVLHGVVLVLVPLGDGLSMLAVKKSLGKAGITVKTSLGVGSSTPFPPLVEDQTPSLSIPSGTNLVILTGFILNMAAVLLLLVFASLLEWSTRNMKVHSLSLKPEQPSKRASTEQDKIASLNFNNIRRTNCN
jgi:hypothetical protein